MVLELVAAAESPPARRRRREEGRPSKGRREPGAVVAVGDRPAGAAGDLPLPLQLLPVRRTAPQSACQRRTWSSYSRCWG